MADPPPFDPCHDPYDSTYFNEELARIFLPTDTPNLNDLSLSININANQTYEDNSYLLPPSQSINQLEDPVRINLGEIGSRNPNLEGASNVQGLNYLEGYIQEGINPNLEGFIQEEGINNNIANAYGGGDGGNAGAVSTWQTVQNPSSSCSGYCQVLRQIHHTNGEDIMKLEIHGTIGFISHVCFGVLPKQDQSEVFHYQMIDFSDKSINEVEQYLTHYFDERTQSGFVLMEDPLASFYRVLSVGFDNPDESFPKNDDVEPSPFRLAPEPKPVANAMEAGPSTSVRGRSTDQSGVSTTESKRKKKTPLAEQRCRTKEMKLEDISSQFTVTIQQAADNLHLSVTVLKKICRRAGLERWPQRKLNSLLKKIDSLKAKMRSGNAEDKAAAEAEIASIEEEIDILCSGQQNNNDNLEAE